MAPGRARYPSRISSKRAQSALCSLLSGCTDERLAGFTAASLAASYNVSLETAERMLVGVRKARGL
jgi:hypothetical protein